MRGQICPSTLLAALGEINRHRDLLFSGKMELQFKTDNREATVTIPESAVNMGYDCQVSREKDFYVVVVRRGDGGEGV